MNPKSEIPNYKITKYINKILKFKIYTIYIKSYKIKTMKIVFSRIMRVSPSRSVIFENLFHPCRFGRMFFNRCEIDNNLTLWRSVLSAHNARKVQHLSRRRHLRTVVVFVRVVDYLRVRVSKSKTVFISVGSFDLDGYRDHRVLSAVYKGKCHDRDRPLLPDNISTLRCHFGHFLAGHPNRRAGKGRG